MRIIDKQGHAQEITLTLEDYKAALTNKLSFKQFLNQKFSSETDINAYGEPYAQMMMSSGMFMKHVPERGIRPPTVNHILEANNFQVQAAGPYLRPDGSKALASQNDMVSNRLFFMSTMFEVIESALVRDESSWLSTFNRMIAVTRAVDSPYIVQPTITTTGPRGGDDYMDTALGNESMPIAQLAAPATMTSISTASKTYRMPEHSIGLEISFQAQQEVTIDLVGLILRRQAEGQRIRWAKAALRSLLRGDTDWGLGSINTKTASTNFSDFDAAATGGVMTHKAWLKWLRHNRYTLTIDWVICTLDMFLKIQDRKGRPTVFNATDTSNSFLNSTPTLVDPSLPGNVNFFDIEYVAGNGPLDIYGADGVVYGLDSRYGIQKHVGVWAQYSAMESYAMRKSDAMRFDVSEAYTRIYDDAFVKTVLT